MGVKIYIDLTKYKENLNYIISLTKKKNINLAVVSKVFLSENPLIDVINESDVLFIGDSNISNFKNIKTNKKKMSLRISSLNDVKEVVNLVDISLESELEVIKKLNEEAKLINKVHEIILMFDLGDLREGLYYSSSYIEVVKEITKLTNIKLRGIGTNLTCYGGVIPDKDVLSRLENIKEKIETNLNIKLDIISGGNSSSIYLLENNELPSFINNLRLGEVLVLGRETAFGKRVAKMHDDVFMLEAEIVELKKKPSYPDGNLGMDAFGNKVNITDQGLMKRAILNIGRQNVNSNHLITTDGSEIIGSSSDHLILNIKDNNYKIGDKIKFKLTYGGILSLMSSNYVEKVYEK